MHVENGTLVMGLKNCTNCNEGKVARQERCPDCKGTGNGKRGGARGCRKCIGFGTHWNHANPVPCPKCNGNHANHEAETLCDSIPETMWKGFTFKVYRGQGTLPTGITLVGLGCVYYCGDYGAAYKANDEAGLIAKVQNDTHGVQGTKVAKDDGTICDHVGIFVTPEGYAVKAVYKK